MKLVSFLVAFFLIQIHNAKQSSRPNHYIRLPWGKSGSRSLLSTEEEQQQMEATNVHIGTGSPKQLFRLKLDTASRELWVFSSAFYTCDLSYPAVKNKHLYNENASSTYTPPRELRPKLIQYGDEWVFGFGIKDIVSLYGGTFEATIIKVIKSSLSIAERKFDGSVGLQYNVDSGNIMSLICNKVKGSWNMFSLYYPRNRTNDDLDECEITICGYDDRRFAPGTLKYVSEIEPGNWKIKIDSIQVNDTRGVFTLSSETTAIIHSGSNRIFGPEAAVGDFYNRIKPYFSGDPAKEPDCLTPRFFPTLIFNIGGEKYTLSGEDYVWKPQTLGSNVSCKVLVQEGDGISDYWSLGEPFMRKYYTVFDMDHHKIGFAENIPLG